MPQCSIYKYIYYIQCIIIYNYLQLLKYMYNYSIIMIIIILKQMQVAILNEMVGTFALPLAHGHVHCAAYINFGLAQL